MKYSPENQQYFNSDFWRWDAQHGAMIVTRAGVVPYDKDRAMWTNNGPALYLTANQQAVVPEGDARAAFLLVAAGGQLDEAEARRWGLLDDESKAKSAPPNKAKAPPTNKAKG